MLGLRSGARQFATAIRALVVATVVLGIAYPLSVTLAAQVAMPGRADGSLTSVNGVTVGSALVGQSFADATGAADPRYFQGRPSAVGYDGAGSGASNLGPENPDLIATIGERKAQVAARDGVSPDQVPADAVTASASGLDPDISPEYAQEQVQRVAAARGLDPQAVRRLVNEKTEGRMLGFLGSPTVNVLALNIALDELSG
jgi:K+-transporting ATPase ATPase C chain